MRAFFMFGTGILAACSTTAISAGPVKPVRGVQLISMVGGASSSDAANRRERLVNAPAAAADLPDSFKVHDLSRRWVEFQMEASLTGAAATATADNTTDLAAQSGVAPIGDVAPVSVSPVSTISVPLWMRGGRAFRASATRFVPGCGDGVYRPAGFLTFDTESRRQSYYTMMSDIACEYGIPVGLFDALIIRESRYRPTVYSPKLAYGLTQLMPYTARDLGVDRYSVEGNLRGGARYLRTQLDKFGQYHLALAAYNAGPGRVRNGLVPRIAETQAYVDNVLANWSRLSGTARIATVQRAGTSAVPLQVRPGRSAIVSTF